MRTANEEQLVRLIAAGDRAAFDELYRRTSPWLAVRLRRRCADDDLVAEVMQETYLTVWRAAAAFTGTRGRRSTTDRQEAGTAVGWLWTIAARRLVDAFRRRARDLRLPQIPVAAESVPAAEDEVLAGLVGDPMAEALRQLAPELREVLQAMVLDGLSVRETSVLLGVPEGTVKTRARRARIRLREAPVMNRVVNDHESAHVPQALLARYAADGPTTQDAHDVWWAVEAHLENCAACRARLATAVAQHSPATADLLERVHQSLAARLTSSEQAPVRRRRLTGFTRWWAAPALLPRLAMTVLVVLAALGLDLADGASAGRFPSLVLLLAPVAPLVGVAAAWSRGLDPAYELVVASPRAGLDLVLRRAAAVLAVVVPLLAAAGWLVGASPARWLVPCLAFTTGALALGELIGLHRAATGLALAWVAVVVGPSLILERTPVLLAAASLPIWAVATAVVALLLILRRRAYTGLASLR